MTKKRYTVTSALPYANGPLHIGHIALNTICSSLFVFIQFTKHFRQKLWLHFVEILFSIFSRHIGHSFEFWHIFLEHS